MNGQHLATMPAAELAPRVVPGLVAAGLADGNIVDERAGWLYGLIDLLKVRSRRIDDIVRQAAPFLRDKIEYEDDAVAKAWKDRESTREILAAARAALAASSSWTGEALEQALRQLAEERGLGAGKLFGPLRVALTGQAASPGIFDVLTLLGRDRSLERVDAAVSYITGNS
jgi:glutamyl-tRNA synthetase